MLLGPLSEPQEDSVIGRRLPSAAACHMGSKATKLLPPGRSCLPSVCSNMAMGMPTFFDLPATTTFFPSVGMPAKEKVES